MALNDIYLFEFLFKVYPLDMSQYSSLFNSTRIPELKKDRLYQDKSKKHILVLRKGNFYTVEVLDENGTLKSIENFFFYCST